MYIGTPLTIKDIVMVSKALITKFIKLTKLKKRNGNDEMRTEKQSIQKQQKNDEVKTKNKLRRSGDNK